MHSSIRLLCLRLHQWIGEGVMTSLTLLTKTLFIYSFVISGYLYNLQKSDFWIYIRNKEFKHLSLFDGLSLHSEMDLLEQFSKITERYLGLKQPESTHYVHTNPINAGRIFFFPALPGYFIHSMTSLFLFLFPLFSVTLEWKQKTKKPQMYSYIFP